MTNTTNEPLAIVGIGCRLPGGVRNPDALWDLLINKHSGIVEVPKDRWDVERYYHPDTAIPIKMHTKWGGFVDNIADFDAQFFGISPREAQRMDPQQRWLLENAWEALEDAGIPPNSLRGSKTGVFVGISSNEYGSIQMMGEAEIDVHTNSGSTLSIASNRISYLFDFKGPSMSVDTACSSALVAVNLACRSIWTGDCTMALAGGVNALLMPDSSIGFSKATMLSPSGQCFAFDARANGYVRGEGAGMIAIKKLSDAEKDGDRIYAIIRASVVNQDGNTSSMTVPGEDSQAAMLDMAYEQAGFEPNRVCYMEAHGTGTPVGDPIETRALGRVLSRNRPDGQNCIIGSIKSNIGHLESGSGIAGLIKAALVAYKGTIPPNINFETPNPNIPFDELKLTVPTEVMPLPRPNGLPAITAVNSFGFGGTNAHIVLEEPPAAAARAEISNKVTRPLLLPVSGNTEAALKAAARSWRDFLRSDQHDLADICYSAGARKNACDERLVVLGGDRSELRENLRAWLANPASNSAIAFGKPAVTNNAPVFVYTGQGAQWWAMGQQLFAQEPVFRDVIEKIDFHLRQLGDWSLVEEMTRDEKSSQINKTNIAQPAIFALQVALTELWKSWGITPSKVVGHSVGEVAAAYAAGIYSLEDAVKIIYHRSRLQDTTGGRGRMAAVGLSPHEGREAIRGFENQVQVAVINSPNMITLAGDTAPLEAIVARLEEQKTFVRWLRIDYAFHTHQMEPIREDLLAAISDIQPQKATIPFISTVTGDVMDGENLNAEYWWQNVRESVLFAPAIANLIKSGDELFLELGPHPALQSSINECLTEQNKKGVVLHSLKRKADEQQEILMNLAALSIQNVAIDWAAVNQSAGNFVSLPAYPWQRERCWLECEKALMHRLGKFDHPLLGVRLPAPQPTWEFLLDPRYFTYLEDHRFWDSIIFPAAGYGEIGLAVARTLFPNEPWAVEELETNKALFISEKKVPQVRVNYNEKEKIFQIHSRAGEGADWELNARGMLRKLPAAALPHTDLKSLRSALPDHFSHEAYYSEYAKAGYQFGPNFSQLENVWRGPNEAVAEIVVPDSVAATVPHYHFHPAVLDACFHAVKGAQVIPVDSKPGDNFFLPAAIRRIRMFVDKMPLRLWSHVKVTFDNRETVISDILVYNDAGERIAEILGFRVDRVEQKDEATESIENSFYQYHWEKMRLHGSRVSDTLVLSSNAAIAADSRETAPVVFEKYGLGAYLADFAPRSKAVVGNFITNAWLDLGWNPVEGEIITFDSHVRSLGILTDHYRLVRAQLRDLTSDGIFEQTGEDTWKILRVPARTNPSEELAQLAREWPRCEPELDLYAITGPRLADVLSGEADPLELLFPGGNSEKLERFYIEGADFLPNNELIRDAVIKAIEKLPPRRALRVLEVGAGTGSLTKTILPILPEDRCEYLFTDNGSAFLADAKKNFASFPFVEYSLFDIEKDPAAQGIDSDSYDLVLATNVIHATKDLKNTLGNLKSTLDKNGLLLFLEVTRERRELDMIFGLLKGWWGFTDTDLRPDSALLPPEKWSALLEDCGFANVAHFDAIPEGADVEAGQTVFCASNPDKAEIDPGTPQKVAILGTVPGLENALTLKGAEIVADIHDADIAIHARSLSASSDNLIEAQNAGTLDLLTLAHSLPENPVKIVVLTRGTQSVLENESITDLASTPLTGFLRVARGEHPEFGWSQIDLDPGTDAHELEDIAEEILASGNKEREIAYRADNRYVARVRQTRIDDLPVRTKNAITEDGLTQYRLQVSTPGMLTNLSLNETSRRAPDPDEIEVQVKAGGINFRDVMKALGMYPGNPIDLRWFGDDFSGTVVRVGENVSDLRPGDNVTGMGPYCFRAFVTVNRAMVFKKPAHLTHVQAATLPTVFLTTHYAINELARMQKGEKILIHAGTGGVGQAAIQIAKDLGLEIFATAGSREKRWLLTEMGVDHVMDSRSLDFADEIMAITGGKGVDAVLNSLAGDFIPKSFSVLAPFGRFLEIGKIDVYGNSKLGLATLKDNISYFVIDLAQHLEYRPAYVAGMLEDVRKKLDAKAYQPLPHEVFPITDAVGAFRYMAQGKHIGKNVLDFELNEILIAPSTDPSGFFNEDASYLITGGASGFGFELAKWMIKHGARHLVLMSRSGPRDAYIKEEIAQLQADGIHISNALGDVTSADDVQRIVSGITPPLRGVIHGAMVLDDQFLVDMDSDCFTKVLYPKMLGAWNLHQATLGCPLDHFIGFSSFSTVIGAVKQANYNAGNYFLDSLASYRHAQGLPALTINWGALTGAGFVERNEKTAAYLEALGMKPFSMEETQYVMQRVLPFDPVRLAASRTDWQQLAKLSPAIAQNPSFAPVARRQSGDDNNASIRPQILGAPADERPKILQDFITEQVAGVFGTEAAKIDRDTPLNNIGLDSLMAIELLNRIESNLGVNVPMGVVLNGPNIKELSVPILEMLIQASDGEAVNSSDAARIESSGSGPDTFPLSEGQRALWFLHQLDPKSPAYNLVFTSKISPLVDIDAMQRAFASLFERHPMLDVTFGIEDGEPVQTLRKGGTINFREHDATTLTESEIKDLLVDHAGRPFDLANGPVVRLELFRTGDSHVVLLSMHHIVSDSWSVSLFMNDLIESYFSIKADRTPEYPPLDYHYSDYVAWEKKELDGSTGEALRSYWTRALADAPNVLDLPVDRPRPALQTFNGGNFGFELDADLTGKIVALTSQHNTTLYSTLLTAFNALLHRYSGQDDIVIGSPMAGRMQKELHGIIGYFVKPVPLRSRADDNPTFSALLDRASQSVRGAIEHQNYPLTRIIDDLRTPRDPSRSPLFQVAFAMERVPGVDKQGIAVFLIGKGGHQFKVADTTVETVDLTLRQAQFELTLVVEEADGILYGSWQYNRDLFDLSTIERLNVLFRRILDSVTAAPDTRLSDIRLVSDEEESRILDLCNSTTADYPYDKPLHDLISAQATLTPNAPAVTCGSTTLSYQELESRANGLATSIRAQGVSAGDIVGLLAERSVDMVVGVLGILKTGACYIPMDPEYPGHRLQQMLDDARPGVIVTHRSLEEKIPNGFWHTVFLDDNVPADVTTSAEEIQPESLAYIIYTSGSTGTPKGVEIPHRAVVNFLTSMRRRPGLTRVDKLLAVTTISFDISVLEIFLPLIAGAEVVIASRDDARDGRRLSALLDEHDISVMQATPATWRMLMDSGWEGRNALRIFCGGEALPRSLADLLVNSAAEVWNLYGPTETTVWSTCARVLEENASVSIGTPIDNTTVYILDERLHPVPEGFAGDLYIGGDGLAHGYHDKPDLTSHTFITVDLPNGQSPRLYKTGDVARWRSDGMLECLGRSDFQIKLRGIRIELEDIESQIASHPGVKQAVVTKRDDLPGGEALVAYLIPENGTNKESLAGGLREYLIDRLPASMRPTFYSLVTSFPLTPNRKIDRRALPAPKIDRENLASEIVGPQTSSERILWDIFSKAFAPRSVGIRDNFFELGGDSLLAVKIVTQASAAFNCDLPVSAFLTNPTIEKLARHLHTTSISKEEDKVIATREINDDYLSVEIGAEEIPKIDAAALAYIPDAFLGLTGLDRDAIVRDWFDNKPRLTNVYETPFGRIGLVLLPCFEIDLYKDTIDLKTMTLDALCLAAEAGAKTVSLTGVIPSVTNNGLEISKWINGSTDLPIITTGDATRTATVVRSMEGILEKSGRNFANESVAIIGLNSIGNGTLELMLDVLPHPKAITLCDFYQEENKLAGLRDRLLASGYEGEIRIAQASGSLPEEVYQSSFIIGATSVPGIIDVQKLAVGTLIVDYSFPPAFRMIDAARRFEERHDILFTTGGQLRLNADIPETIYLPSNIESLLENLDPARLHALAGREAREITGCILASLVTGQEPDVRVTLGEVKPEDCLAHYQYLAKIEAKSAALQIDGYVLSEDHISKFRSEATV